VAAAVRRFPRLVVDDLLPVRRVAPDAGLKGAIEGGQDARAITTAGRLADRVGGPASSRSESRQSMAAAARRDAQ
jgi:hypothetical protein